MARTRRALYSGACQLPDGPPVVQFTSDTAAVRARTKGQSTNFAGKRTRRTGHRVPGVRDVFSPHLERDIPHPPDPSSQGQLEELLLFRIEEMMTKAQPPTVISKTLGISLKLAVTAIERIRYRQDLYGSGKPMRRIKGEARTRLDLITRMLHDVWDDAKGDGIVRGAVCRELLKVHAQRLIVDGLTKKGAENAANDTSSGKAPSVDDLQREHMNVVELATALQRQLTEMPAGAFDELIALEDPAKLDDEDD